MADEVKAVEISPQQALARVVASQRDDAMNQLAELQVMFMQMEQTNKDLGALCESQRKMLESLAPPKEAGNGDEPAA